MPGLEPILAAGHANITWHLIPMAAAISLVYSASRYELTGRIITRAIRLFAPILVIMGAAFLLLLALSYNL